MVAPAPGGSAAGRREAAEGLGAVILPEEVGAHREEAAGPSASTPGPAGSRHSAERPAGARDPAHPSRVRSADHPGRTARPRRHRRTKAPTPRSAPAELPAEARRRRAKAGETGVRCRPSHHQDPGEHHPIVVVLPANVARHHPAAGRVVGPACRGGDPAEGPGHPAGAAPVEGAADPVDVAAQRTERRWSLDHHSGPARSGDRRSGRHARRSRVEPPGQCVGDAVRCVCIEDPPPFQAPDTDGKLTRPQSSAAGDRPHRSPGRTTGRGDSNYMSGTPLRRRR